MPDILNSALSETDWYVALITSTMIAGCIAAYHFAKWRKVEWFAQVCYIGAVGFGLAFMAYLLTPT